MDGAGKGEKHQRYPLSLMELPYMTDSVEIAKRPDVLSFWSNDLLYQLIQPFYFTLVIGRLFAPVVYGAGNFSEVDSQDCGRKVRQKQIHSPPSIIQ
jgi:hypothetical protein